MNTFNGMILASENPLFGVSSDGRGIYVFGFEIYFYALVIVTGMIVATALSALLMKRRNMSSDLIFALFVVCIPSALICARLYYCIKDGMDISRWFAWESIRDGGLSILGGVMGGVLAGLVVCTIKRVNFFRAADCVVITILIAQAIGRWGNYFNKEVYGAEITDPSAQWFPWAVQIGSKWYHALFFYESVINTIGFLLLYTAAWFYDRKPNGVFTFLYFVWYGAVRAIMEPMRNPNYILGSDRDVMSSQITAIILFVLGIVAIVALLVINYLKEGSLIGSKRGEKSGIKKYLPCYKDEKPYFSKINMYGYLYPPAPPKEKKKKKAAEGDGEKAPPAEEENGGGEKKE